MTGFAGVLHVFAGVKKSLGIFGVGSLQRGNRCVVESIDQPGPRRGVLGNHLLNGFGLQLNARVLGLLAVLCDETARNTQQVCGFHQLHRAASYGRPLLIRFGLTLFGAGH